MRAAPKLVIFDVDGTLIDSQDHIHAAMAYAFDVTGQVLPPRDAVLAIVGLSLPEAVVRLVPELPAEARDRIVDAYKQSFARLRGMSQAPFFPGARQVLDQLRGRPDEVQGVATGKSRRGLEQILSSHDLHGYFLTHQVADDHPSKPHPAMIRAALSETGTAPENAVMIGDTSFDMQMGGAAGIQTIGVTWGYHRRDALLAAGAGQIIASFEALIPALETVWSAK